MNTSKAGFQKSLHPFALDKSSLSIGRVKENDSQNLYYINILPIKGFQKKRTLKTLSYRNLF